MSDIGFLWFQCRRSTAKINEAGFGFFSTVTKLSLMRRGKITAGGKITDVGKHFPIEFDGWLFMSLCFQPFEEPASLQSWKKLFWISVSRFDLFYKNSPILQVFACKYCNIGSCFFWRVNEKQCILSWQWRWQQQWMHGWWHDDEHVDANDVDDDDEHGGVEAAFQNYKTEKCWETQLAAIFLFNADGCGWVPST